MKPRDRLIIGLFGLGIAILPARLALALPATEVGKIAKQVTVKIEMLNEVGSGSIVKQEGKTYFVLTAKHVVSKPNEKYTLVTPDGDRYPLDVSKIKLLPEVDLAVVQFQSSKSYKAAQLGNAKTLTEGATVYVSGFPKKRYQFTTGNISSILSPQETRDGYGISYINNTSGGMSGGPVLDENGYLVAVHGRASAQNIKDPESGGTVSVKDGYNLGIAIDIFQKLAPKAGINLKLPIATAPLRTRPNTTRPTSPIVRPSLVPTGSTTPFTRPPVFVPDEEPPAIACPGRTC